MSALTGVSLSCLGTRLGLSGNNKRRCYFLSSQIDYGERFIDCG
jgi:hypothetical protein